MDPAELLLLSFCCVALLYSFTYMSFFTTVETLKTQSYTENELSVVSRVIATSWFMKKDEKRFAVQVSDTTMLNSYSTAGQKNLLPFSIK